MFSVLTNRIYRHLFLAQVIALLGTGLATVALGLLAFDLAGEAAGAVLGTALAIKMAAYVGIAPVAAALGERLPRRAMLVALDIVRAGVAVLLPFVTEIWQIYVLIFLLQSASAAFTPSFQATIPDVLPDERDYTRALSLSRLAYDLENLVSPVLAAVLLTVFSFQTLFAGTVFGFLASAALVLSVILPSARPATDKGVYRRIAHGAHVYLATPRLRGLLSLNLAAAAAGAMVIVNTVVVVRATYGRPETDVAIALAAFGAGSMLTALLLPRLLDRLNDRTVMLAGAATMVTVLTLFGILAIAEAAGWPIFLATWLALGLGYSAVLTPTGRLLRRSAQQHDRPLLFAAQFTLSHACWFVTYPLAGWLGMAVGMVPAIFALAAIATIGIIAAIVLWPADDPERLSHVHTDLPEDHPHVRGAEPTRQGLRHSHPFVIDDHHRHWPV